MNNTEFQMAAIEALGKVIFDLKNEVFFKRLEIKQLTDKVAELEAEIAKQKGETE